MKVRDLIEMLERVPEDFDVVMSSDGEGNNFSPCAGAEKVAYCPENTWSGSLEYSEDGEEPIEPNAVVLWPTN